MSAAAGSGAVLALRKDPANDALTHSSARFVKARPNPRAATAHPRAAAPFLLQVWRFGAGRKGEVFRQAGVSSNVAHLGARGMLGMFAPPLLPTAALVRSAQD